MKLKFICLITFIFLNIATGAETPKLILGAWKIDFEKTISQMKKLKNYDKMSKKEIEMVKQLSALATIKIEANKLIFLIKGQQHVIDFEVVSHKGKIITVKHTRKVETKEFYPTINFHIIDQDNLSLERPNEPLLQLKRVTKN